MATLHEAGKAGGVLIVAMPLRAVPSELVAILTTHYCSQQHGRKILAIEHGRPKTRCGCYTHPPGQLLIRLLIVIFARLLRVHSLGSVPS